jgi:hypothetical protein
MRRRELKVNVIALEKKLPHLYGQISLEYIREMGKNRKKGVQRVTITLESNFMLLGDRDIMSIDFDRPSVFLAELLDELSRRSTNTTQFFLPGKDSLLEGWEIEVNGRAFADLTDGLSTALRDGDRVAITLVLLGGG